MAKYGILFSLTGETAKQFVAKPSDRAAVVRGLAESAGGSLESYYWMFGQYDGLAIFDLPDSQTAAALSLAATGSGAFTKFETTSQQKPVILSRSRSGRKGSATSRRAPDKHPGCHTHFPLILCAVDFGHLKQHGGPARKKMTDLCRATSSWAHI